MLEHSVETYLRRQTTDTLWMLLYQQDPEEGEYARYLAELIGEILKERGVAGAKE